MEYRIIYSNRKTLAIEVDSNANIIVRSPKSLSKRKIEKFLTEKSDWLQKAVEKQRQRASLIKTYSEEEIKNLRKKAKEIIPERVKIYSEIIGVTPKSVKITSAKKRYGSCSAKNNLCFSLYLADFPIDAIDYVVVHELCHILEHNHSRRFWARVAKYLPDYKQREQILKNKNYSQS